MVNHDDARRIALDFIKGIEGETECELALVDRDTIERDLGWVFFYESREHLETGNEKAALLGNAPIVVTRIDGRVHETGTRYPLEHYLRELAKPHTDE
jgi:hypothetical protein